MLSTLNVGVALSTRHPTPRNYSRTRIPEEMIKRISTLAATSTMVLGLAAAGAMGTTTAFAGGGPTFQCVNAPLEVLKVECISVPITFETSVDHVLNGNELNVLSGDLNSNSNTSLSNDLNPNP